jgi:hypothetical protein
MDAEQRVIAAGLQDRSLQFVRQFVETGDDLTQPLNALSLAGAAVAVIVPAPVPRFTGV